MADILEILDVERIDSDIYRGPAIVTHLQRTFGGQVAGQCLVSASRTVDADKSVHSLHGYFIRPGIPDLPTVFRVDRLRDGRSFSTRHVTAVQNGRPIFSMSASFHLGVDEGVEHQDVMTPVPAPEDVAQPFIDVTPEQQKFLDEWAQWDVRIVPAEAFDRNPNLASQQKVWFRCRDRLPDDPTIHVCSLAYMSDMTLLGSAKVPHADVPTQDASLDHAMWFLRPFRVDDWLLYDQTSPSASGGRALTQGRIFDRRGRLVAAVTQEGLSRLLRAGGQRYPVAPDAAL